VTAGCADCSLQIVLFWVPGLPRCRPRVVRPHRYVCECGAAAAGQHPTVPDAGFGSAAWCLCGRFARL